MQNASASSGLQCLKDKFASMRVVCKVKQCKESYGKPNYTPVRPWAPDSYPAAVNDSWGKGEKIGFY